MIATIQEMTIAELKAALRVKLGQKPVRTIASNILFDTVIDEFNLKNDVSLSRFTKIPAAHISQIRSGVKNVSAGAIIKIHEATNMPIARIKELAGQA